MSKNKLITALTIIFGIITIGNFFWHVYLYRADIFTKFDYGYWSYRYSHSQWSTAKCLVTDPHINPHTCIWDDNWYALHPKILPEFQKISIGDDGLYMYTGAAYVKGQDPSLVNAELPPLGKYLVGIFEIVTGYNGIFSVFFSGLALLLLFLFNKSVFKSSLLSVIPVMFFSFEPLFTSQIRAPYLDTLYLSILLLGFLLFFRKKYIFAGIVFGAFMAVKSPFLIVIVYATIVSMMYLQKQMNFKRLFLMLLATIGIYILTYFSVFLHGHSFSYFIGVQKYILHFYSTGAKAVMGAVFPMLFTGRWFTWFSPVQQVEEWMITWPLLSIGGLLGFILWLKNKNSGVLLQMIWLLYYLIFLIFTPVFARYLLLVIPFLYNLSIWSLSAVIRSKSS